MTLDNFKKTIWNYYHSDKRSMPWRQTRDVYAIVVSEIMLQQTQVPRVMSKYHAFLKAFPTFKQLATASNQDVLKVWSGMGYNRRALYLKKIAEIVVNTYDGTFPQDPHKIDELPGIGQATAQSIAAFAFNYPAVFIETNIRRVFIHFFFNDKDNVDDNQILPLVEKSLDRGNPKEWYYALMDYGTMLAKKMENPNKKSKHYLVQSQFEGSDRQMRGQILKELLRAGPKNVDYLRQKLSDEERLQRGLKALLREGFIMEEKGKYRIK